MDRIRTVSLLSALSLGACGAPGAYDIGSSAATVTVPADAAGLELVTNESFITRPLSGSSINEHCAIPADLVASLGLAPPQQLRIQIDDDHYAVCTVVANQNSPQADEVVMTAQAIADKGLAAGATVSLSLTVANPAHDAQPTWNEWRAAVAAAGDFAERSDARAGALDSGKTCLASAPHGGAIDANGTDHQAREVGDHLAGGGEDCSVWVAAGFDPPSGADGHDVWHTTATELSVASFPQLDALVDARTGGRWDWSIAFHAMGSSTAGCMSGGSSCQKIFVGGGITGTQTQTDLIAAIQTALAAVPGGSNVTVQAPPPGSPVAGVATRNIVNRLAVNGLGIQLEQTAFVITNFGNVVADAVADFVASH